MSAGDTKGDAEIVNGPNVLADPSSEHKVRVSKNDETIKVEEFVDCLYALEADTTIAKTLKVAWNYWNEQLKEKQQRLDNKNGEAKDLKTEVYQLIGFYTVFQGVLFHGVSALSHGALHPTTICGFSWLPITLSAFTSIAALVGVSTKFLDLQMVKHSVVHLNGILLTLNKNINKLGHEGVNFDASSMTKGTITSVGGGWWFGGLKECLVLVCLLVLSVGFAYTYRVILCNWFN